MSTPRDYEEPYDSDLDDLAGEDCTLDPAAADLPDLSDETVERPPENDDSPQDVVPEGMGALPKAPRHWRDAIKTAVGYARNGQYVEAGYCLRECREYYGVGPLYAAAKDSLAGAQRLGKARRVHDWNKVPRGVLVYWTGPNSQYGHIAISLGGGYVISTDWPRNRYGRVHGGTLMNSWGYTAAFWAPLVNDTRVWPAKEKRNPKPKGPRINRARVNRSLKHPGKYDGETALGQLKVVRNALRDRGWDVEGYGDHPEASVRRVLRKFQEKQGWKGSGADGLLGRKTAKLLGLNSYWAPLPGWKD